MTGIKILAEFFQATGKMGEMSAISQSFSTTFITQPVRPSRAVNKKFAHHPTPCSYNIFGECIHYY